MWKLATEGEKKNYWLAKVTSACLFHTSHNSGWWWHNHWPQRPSSWPISLPDSKLIFLLIFFLLWAADHVKLWNTLLERSLVCNNKVPAPGIWGRKSHSCKPVFKVEPYYYAKAHKHSWYIVKMWWMLFSKSCFWILKSKMLQEY